MCFYFDFTLGPTYETYKHVEVKVLVFSVWPSMYFEICSEKYDLCLGIF